MWTFGQVVELGFLVLAVGTAFGLGLRTYDEWLDKRKASQAEAVSKAE